MEENTQFKILRNVKRLLVYRPPTEPSRFVLGEGADDGRSEAAEEKGLKTSAAELAALARYGRRLETTMAKVQAALTGGAWVEEGETLRAECAALEKQWAELRPVLLAYDATADNLAERPVSTSLEENRKIVERLYRLPANKDVVMRHIMLGTEPPLKATLVFMEGLTNGQFVTLGVIQPLMLLADKRRQLSGDGLLKQISEQLLPGSQVKQVGKFRDVQAAINMGDTVIFFDGAVEALQVETKGWEHRGVDRPMTEQTIRGSQAGFSENLRVNTALVRSMLRATDLVTELIPVGARTRMNCAVMYLESVANPKLVAEVKRRIKKVDTDYLNDSGLLEQFIGDRFILPLPQALSTERPDRVAAHLSEGRVAIILEGSPFALVVPALFFTFFHSGEDFSLQPAAANFLRFLRLFGTLISTILPGLYIALTYFHQEALPSELALAIAAAREEVPFPAWFEVFMMEVSFELIREAGIRIPGMLGTTIGIVGAIILGQAAVAARIVSPIIVILVAITGLASSVIPEFRMALFARLSRFGLLLASVTMGLVGLASGMLVMTVALCSMKSFGVPYMVPVAPRTVAGLDVVVRGAAWQRERRPDALNPLDPSRQAKNSREWEQGLPAGEDDK
ncbi:spore germination protein [Anaeroselena agilis]|uniref:Spore germination protein n=1 Tax=Anaeroselena agilis TaxID=3063788 RepID=A0ABU3NUM1_9FIRM|nr:spore germination protein [Selenomonadales bacterium 4137-cl]